MSHDNAAAGGASVIAAPCAEEGIEHASSIREFDEVIIDDRISLSKGRISGSETAEIIGDKRVQENDLIPRLYEGGFKLWEGALDMCRLLRQEFEIGDDLFTSPSLAGKLQGMKVLELGCGHGLPGILCLLAGATVHFQDYNPQVLHELTMPNVRANLARLPPGRSRPNARYFSGDWASTGAMLNSKGLGGHYDVVLASECIYCTESQYHLLECIKQVLQPPMGVAYIAAKVYYFGVGGGTDSFMKLVNSDGIYESKTVKVIEETSSGNKREVIRLKFPDSIAPFFL